MWATGSLRLRLLAAAACAVAIALAISGYVLESIFSRHVDARALAELTNHANQILSAIELDAASQIQLTAAPADPRFFAPSSGLYWQIDSPPALPLRSRSLWETALVLPPDYLPDGMMHRHEIAGPSNSRLIALERGLTIGPAATPQNIRLTVAVDQAETASAVAGFRTVLQRSLTVLGLALLTAHWLQVAIGLRPLQAVKSALEQVHSGAHARLQGAFPTEIQPLVATMNALLEREQRSLDRAHEQAGNLAHGLKTPLTVLAAVSRDLQRDGNADAARELDTQIDMMDHHVQRELARARSQTGGAMARAQVPVAPVVHRLVRALERIGGDRHLSWNVVVDPAATFPGNEHDLLELLGNVAENAAKWAKSRILITIAQVNGYLTLSVDDDGPGIPEEMRDEVLKRGRRLDEAGDGTGLGLSIVARLVEAYGGTVTLDKSGLGGLSVRMSVPASPTLRQAPA